jgi:hypothetical protein
MSRILRFTVASIVASGLVAGTAGAAPLKIRTLEAVREVSPFAEAWERLISWLVQIPRPHAPQLSAMVGAEGGNYDPNGGPH